LHRATNTAKYLVVAEDYFYLLSFSEDFNEKKYATKQRPMLIFLGPTTSSLTCVRGTALVPEHNHNNT